ncbi:MAG TPA: VWA domain-containing protein [Bacteroidia bacterium]|nr:VWA domain-containing protein [Bacteroidia bacterium]
MIRFAHPEYLYALGLIPIVLILFIWMSAWKRKAIRRFGDQAMMKELRGNSSSAKPVLKLVFLLLALSMFVLAWANPQMGTRLEEVKREGVDIIIALDVSNSMRAEDIKPNRLERAKQAISRLIDKLENDRIGLIVFAGRAYVQLPITTDFAAAKLFLNTIETDMIPTQGTSITSAIELAQTSFVGNDQKHKALIIITDGENHEDDPEEAAKKAAEEGIVIHTIGFGSPDGAPIPVYRNGVQVDFFKDHDGNTVLTKLDELTLEKIASEGKGSYIRATNSDDGLEAAMAQIGKMEKKSFGTKQFTDYEDRFQYFLAAGLFFMFLENIISTVRSRWIQKLNLFGENNKALKN